MLKRFTAFSAIFAVILMLGSFGIANVNAAGPIQPATTNKESKTNSTVVTASANTDTQVQIPENRTGLYQLVNSIQNLFAHLF